MAAEGKEGTAELTGEPDGRTVVLLFDESVDLVGHELKALRIPDGTADVVADAVAVFQSR